MSFIRETRIVNWYEHSVRIAQTRVNHELDNKIFQTHSMNSIDKNDNKTITL